jgi:hypothetical protein
LKRVESEGFNHKNTLGRLDTRVGLR